MAWIRRTSITFTIVVRITNAILPSVRLSERDAQYHLDGSQSDDPAISLASSNVYIQNFFLETWLCQLTPAKHMISASATTESRSWARTYLVCETSRDFDFGFA